MRKLILIVLCLVLAPCLAFSQVMFLSGSNPYTAVWNIDDLTTQYSGTPPGWDFCTGSCAGGGGNATTTQTFANMTHALDGNGSMEIAFTDPVCSGGCSGGTDWLWTWKDLGGSGNDALIATFTHGIATGSFYPDTAAGAIVTEIEQDSGFFSPLTTGANRPDGTNWMFGSQCKGTPPWTKAGTFQIWDGGKNSGGGNGAWVDAVAVSGTIPCPVNVNGWNSFVITWYFDPTDQSSCVSSGLHYPLMHYVSITWNGHTYFPLNTNTCAQPLHSGWNSLVFLQVQADVGNAGGSGHIYYDKLKFQYF